MSEENLSPEEREEIMRKLFEEKGINIGGGVKRSLKKLHKGLDCDFEECPERVHRFMMLSNPDTERPMALSMCVKDGETGEITELIFSIRDAALIVNRFGTLIMRGGLR